MADEKIKGRTVGRGKVVERIPKAILDNINSWLNPTASMDYHTETSERAVNFVRTCQQFKEKGYIVDKDSSFLIRSHFEKQDEIKYTILDIVFTRPSDIHIHADAGEGIYTLSGAGTVYVFNEITRKMGEYKLKEGVTKFIPVGYPHCFDTDEWNPLEIRLTCTERLDPKKELTLKRFDEWDGPRLVAGKISLG